MKKFWIFSGIFLFGAIVCAVTVWWLDRALAYKVSYEPPVEDTIGIIPVTEPPIPQDVDLVIAIDNSGSMCCTPGTDKQNLRLRAAELVITSLAADIYPRQTSIALVTFGDRAELTQSLISIGDSSAREQLVKKIQDPGYYSNSTNIVEALDVAYRELFESGNHIPTNTPALVLLTDGEPTGLGIPGGLENTKQNIIDLVEKLTNHGTQVFVIMLRDPSLLPNYPRLAEWDETWRQMSLDLPNVIYYEASQADQLEEIYNNIRNRLDEMGKTGERILYDPNQPGEHILFPPNLLKAVLIIRKPDPKIDVQLVLPDGQRADAIAMQDPENIGITDIYASYFKVYTLREPVGGEWTLVTTGNSSVKYILDLQGLYNTQVFLPVGQEYLSLNDESTIYASVVDQNGNNLGAGFDLEAILAWDVLVTADNLNGREFITLPDFEYSEQLNKYVMHVPADLIPGSGKYNLMIQGTGSDGSIVNMVQYEVEAIDVPGGIEFILPSSIVCSDPQPLISFELPPQFICADYAQATLTLNRPGDTRLETLDAKLVGPIEETMESTGSAGGFTASYGPLTSPGDYTIAAILSGETQAGYQFIRRAQATTHVLLPQSLYDLRERVFMAMWLLLITALWKPIIVWLLAIIWTPIRLVPRGRYTVFNPDPDGQISIPGDHQPRGSISRQARAHRQLFGARIGPNEPIHARMPVVKVLGRSSSRIQKIKSLPILRWILDDQDHPYYSIRVRPFQGISTCMDEQSDAITTQVKFKAGLSMIVIAPGEKPDLFDWIFEKLHN